MLGNEYFVIARPLQNSGGDLQCYFEWHLTQEDAEKAMEALNASLEGVAVGSKAVLYKAVRVPDREAKPANGD